MSTRRAHLIVGAGVVLLAGNLAVAGGHLSNPITVRNEAGEAQTYSTQDGIDTTNPFFQPLGSNGRACVNCHEPSANWGITPAQIQQKFNETGGLDPLFRTNDGTNSPNCDMSTLQARTTACNMLLSKGLIRVGIGIPTNAEFELAACDDPYGYAEASELSLFRRPLPSTNLRFLTGVMWDGREGKPDATTNLTDLLAHQATDATLGHAQATLAPTPDQVKQIVDFEMALTTAQSAGKHTGDLNDGGANGGVPALFSQPFHLGLNDVLGADPTGALFDKSAMKLFGAWAQPSNNNSRQSRDRQSVARGEVLFNTKPINITGVAGLNDDLHAVSIQGTCTTCHDTPNVGNHSVPLPIDIGLTDESRRTPDMPLYTLRNLATGEIRKTTDPGRALITGKWKDIGKFKGAVLRGLSGRAPYFHNGSAKDLGEAVDFYDTRFGIGFTPQEKADLVAFLQSL